MIKVKRVYEPVEKHDGYRVLVDRLWPRGLSKESAAIDLWLKEIAPSTELRKWFNHDPDKWPEFQKRYKDELKARQALIEELRALQKKQHTVTLLYSAKNEALNQAIVLRKEIGS